MPCFQKSRESCARDDVAVCIGHAGLHGAYAPPRMAKLCLVKQQYTFTLASPTARTALAIGDCLTVAYTCALHVYTCLSIA